MPTVVTATLVAVRSALDEAMADGTVGIARARAGDCHRRADSTAMMVMTERA
jgi:hypothetical protein